MLRLIQAFALLAALHLGAAGSDVSGALVGHYRLDETTPGPVVNEVGPDGSNSGATINQLGQIDGAYDYNGIAQYSTIANPGVGAGSFSVAAWINLETLAGNETSYGSGVVRSTANDLIGDFFLSVDHVGRLHFANWRTLGNDTTGLSFTAPGVVTAGSWLHVAATWDGSLNRMYVNGTPVSIAGTESTGTGWGIESSLGRNFGNPGYFINGLIDDVGIWTNTLSDADVATIYANGLLGFDLNESPPVVLQVPEPSSWCVLAAGGAGLVWQTQRRVRRARGELTLHNLANLPPPTGS